MTEIDEELMDPDRARAILVGELEERVRVLVAKPALHGLDGLPKLKLVELARIVHVGVAKGITHMLNRPPAKEIRHHLHCVLLRASDGRSIDSPEMIRGRVRPDSRWP